MTEAYQTQQDEIDGLNAHITKIQTDLELKHQYSENQKQQHKANTDMLQSHIDRLKNMLEQKTTISDDLDTQNRSLIQQIGDLKRTINELNHRTNSLTQEHRYEIENADREWSDKYHTMLSQNEASEMNYKS